MSQNRKASTLPPEVLDELAHRALLEVAKMQELEERAEEVAERTARLTPLPVSTGTAPPYPHHSISSTDTD